MRVCACQCLGRTGVYFIPTTTETCCPHCKRHTCQPVSHSITSHKDLKWHDSYTLIYTNKHTIFMIRQQMFFSFFQLLITKVSFHVQEQHFFICYCWSNLILQSTLKKWYFLFIIYILFFFWTHRCYVSGLIFFSCWRTPTNCLHLKKYISFGTNCEQKKFPKLRGTIKSGSTWHSLWTLTQPPNIFVIRTG